MSPQPLLPTQCCTHCRVAGRSSLRQSHMKTASADLRWAWTLATAGEGSRHSHTAHHKQTCSSSHYSTLTQHSHSTLTQHSHSTLTQHSHSPSDLLWWSVAWAEAQQKKALPGAAVCCQPSQVTPAPQCPQGQWGPEDLLRQR